MNLRTFRERHPAFGSVTDVPVQAALDAAALELGPDWGARYDEAHGLQAAHKLWSSPSGASMRMEGGDAVKSPYLTQYDELVNKTFLGAFVT